MSRGENILVQWLTERLVADPGRVPIGIGDDMAVVRLDGSLVAVTADMLLDGVHFDTAHHRYEEIGRKAIACSLSDCAGMACRPRAATISIALHEKMTLEDVQLLYEGMAGIAGEFDCPLVGGDTTSWPGRLAIDVAMLAEPMALRGAVTRSGARVGDGIYVTGPLGGSLAGHHLSFTPRLALAERLADRAGLHALMDISDGLAMDLDRLCRASGCGARLEEDQLAGVVSDAARMLADHDGVRALDHALTDGEDFELLVVGDESLTAAELGLTWVGSIVSAEQAGATRMVLAKPDGSSMPLEPKGFEHFR